MPGAWATDPKDWNVGELLTAAHTNTELRDRMKWLKARPYGKTTITVQTTTSTSFVLVTGATVALTTFGGDVHLMFIGTWSNSNVGVNQYADLAIDTVRLGNSSTGIVNLQQPVAAYNCVVVAEWMTSSGDVTTPAAGAHTFGLYWKVAANTGSILGTLFAWEHR